MLDTVSLHARKRTAVDSYLLTIYGHGAKVAPSLFPPLPVCIQMKSHIS